MATVHRNATPPKRLLWKKECSFDEWDFKEDHMTKWAKENLTGHMQYDFIVFEGKNRFMKKTIEFKAWFQNKQDSELFARTWLK